MQLYYTLFNFNTSSSKIIKLYYTRKSCWGTKEFGQFPVKMSRWGRSIIRVLHENPFLLCNYNSRYQNARRRNLMDDALADVTLLTFMMQEVLLPRELLEIWVKKAVQMNDPQVIAILLAYQERHFGAPDPEKERRRMMRELESDRITAASFRANWRSRKNDSGGITLLEYLGVDSIVSIPAFRGKEPVTELKDSLFAGNPHLKSVTIPNGIQILGKDTFRGCRHLQSVELPATVKRIDADAFRGCASLLRVTIPNGVQSIGRNAFQGCSSLGRSVSRRT